VVKTASPKKRQRAAQADRAKARAPIASPPVIAEANAAPVAATNDPPLRLIYKPELLALVGVSYGSIFSWMRRGEFPLAREIGPGGRSTRIAWIESEIMAWLAARPQRRMKAAAPKSGSSSAPSKIDA
jgi:predicted DNA-binding transcriptional regulator AlpA